MEPNSFNQNQNNEPQEQRSFYEESKEHSADTPLWYSVSYSGNGAYPDAGEVFPLEMTERKKRKRRTVLLVSLLLVSVILLSAMAGAGAYFFAKHMDTSLTGTAGFPIAQREMILRRACNPRRMNTPIRTMPSPPLLIRSPRMTAPRSQEVRTALQVRIK